VSNTAPPVPKLLKEVKHGNGQYAKRIENRDRLLRWAVQYIDVTCTDLIRCHSDSDGGIKDREVQVEISRLKRWMAMARSTLPGDGAEPTEGNQT
jgi:hypothetical protein